MLIPEIRSILINDTMIDSKISLFPKPSFTTSTWYQGSGNLEILLSAIFLVLASNKNNNVLMGCNYCDLNGFK